MKAAWPRTMTRDEIETDYVSAIKENNKKTRRNIMKLGHIIIVALLAIMCTIGAQVGFGKFQDFTDPKVHIQNAAKECGDQLTGLNANLESLYVYQKDHNIQGVEQQVAIFIPKRTFDALNKQQAAPTPKPTAAPGGR